jgi:hypothetical protein
MELVFWKGGAARKCRGEVGKIFEEYLNTWETGGGCCIEFGRERVVPGPLYIVRNGISGGED